MPERARGGAGGEKTYGRWKRKPGNLRYLHERRDVVNKAGRLFKYMKRFPNYPMPTNLKSEVEILLKRLIRE